MHRRFASVVLTLLVSASVWATAPIKLELIEAKKIWDEAPHSAFTDLVRFEGEFYCAFREGRGHVSTDGRIRVLRSTDGDAWSSAAVVSLQGYDLRDAHLCITPDGQLMLVGGAAPRKKDSESAPTGSFVAFSKDGTAWTAPEIVVKPGRWMWCVTWHKGKAYGVSYSAPNNGKHLALLTSLDGRTYEPHVPRLFEEGYSNETRLRFVDDGTCYALVRRDRHGDDPSTPVLGISKAGYTEWQWHDLGTEFNRFGGPNFIRLRSGHWIATGRMHQGGAHTALTYLDVENKKMTTLLRLPSGGDTSYPGLLEHDGILYVSYYSSHEGRTSIYLAKVRVIETSKDNS